MKCPKCGSVIHKRIEKLNYYQRRFWYRCENVECELHKEFDTNKLNDLREYQQRLDKVLSKFDGAYVKTYHIPNLSIFIEYWSDKTFRLTSQPDGTQYDIEISLDTVESLLKDLEAQDE